MAKERFDVDDAGVREVFLRYRLGAALTGLAETACPAWGRMTPQQMVEHLVWAFEVSTGAATTVCAMPEHDLPRLKDFLYHNRPTPREFVNPALAAGLPPLRYANLDDARAALAREALRFLDGEYPPGTRCVHPIFGPIGHDEWHRAHYKHAHHHLTQFDLLRCLIPNGS